MKNKIKYAVIIFIIGGMIMYTRVNWQNAPSTATPVNAENLNIMDKGIADAHSQLSEKANQTEISRIDSQLADKANKDEVFTKENGININDFDKPTRQTFLELQGIDVNYVLGEKNVKKENIDDKAVTYDKQDIINVDADGHVKLNVITDISDSYKNEWINFITNSWGPTPKPRSIIHPIRKNSRIKIETKGNHNRFTIFTSKFDTYITANNDFKTIFVKNDDGISEGNEEYEFFNDDDGYVIVGISTGDDFPTVALTESFEEGSKRRLDALDNIGQDIGYLPITNMVNNGDFSKGNEGWYTVDATFTTDNGVARMLASNKRGAVRQVLQRIKGYKYYMSAKVKSSSNIVGIDINGALPEYVRHSGSGSFEHLSTVFTAPTTGFWEVGIQDLRSTNWDVIEFKDFVVVDLTSVYGFGNEPELATMDRIVNDFLDGFFEGTVSNYVTIPSLIKKHEEDLIKLTKKPENNTGIANTKEIYPVMFGVKMSNEKDVTRGYTTELPRPVGWLYYIPEEPYEILYANGTPDNMKHLCYWKKEVTWNGTSTPDWYRPFITKDGDIIFVWRGDELGLMDDHPDSRQNPIIYPAGDWDNPVEVDLGNSLKPTAWLQNCGADYIYNQNVFLFAEYTRPHHKTANVWKVTKPITDPNNWRVVKSFELSGSNQVGMKHCHTINYDTFSSRVYLTTGDDDDAAKIFSSSDFGETWDLEYEGDRRYARVLNFSFTQDKVYWANDDSAHGFYSVDRDANGVPDFSNIETLYDLTGYPPTYINVLIDDPYGILILNRYDGDSEGPLKVLFWDLETSTMHEIKDIHPVEGVPSMIGFRVEACNFYTTKGNNKVVAGFARPRNSMDLLGNIIGNGTIDRVNNLVLEVVKDGEGFDLKISAINDVS